MKKESNKFIKILKNKKLIRCKYVFAVFSVAILLLSGISTGLESLTIKKETADIFQLDETHTLENKIDTLYHPDITQTRDENFIGNTGQKLWYFYIEGLINSANGNLYISANDISIKARGFDIEIIRSYNSLNANYSTGFGYGWTFNYNTYLIDKESYVLWVEGDGSVHNFTSVGEGNYNAPPGIYSRLNKNIDDMYTLWFKEGEKYSFDTSGLLQTITDKNDNHLTFTYFGQQLIRISDDSSMQLNISYNERNKISCIEDPLGRKITYVYDIYDNLIRVDDAMGYSTKYLYSCCHKLSSYVDKENVALSFSYFEDSKKVDDVRCSVYDVSSQFHYNGFMVLFIVYDEVNNTVYYLNAENYASALILNEEGNPIEFIDSLNGSTFSEWVNHSLVKSIDGNGNVFQYEYDSYGNLITVIDPLLYELRYDWETIDTSERYISQLRNITKVAYDPIGDKYEIINDTFDPANPIPGWKSSPNWVKVIAPFYYSPPEAYGCNFGWYGQGWYETLQSPYFNVSDYTNVELSFWHMRDFDGDPSVGYMPDGGNVKISTDGGQTWTLIHPEGGYDGKLVYGQGNPMEVEHAFGYSTLWTWVQERFDLTAYVGKATNVSIRFEMGTDINPSGHKGWYIDDFLITGYNISERNITTSVSYDENGNIIEINDYTGNSSFYSYDQNGNMINLTDNRGYETTFTYDDQGYLRNITNTLGNTTGYKYDSIGRLINITDANGHTTSHVYNDNDLLIRSIDPTGNYSTFQYNKNGGLTSVIDENGHQTNFTISVVGRVEEIQDPAGNVTYYKTTRTGEPTRTTDANDNTKDTGYDPLGRPVSETGPYGNTDWWGYDAVGNIIWMMDKNNGITHYQYDKLNRLTRTIYPDFSLVTYKYNEFGDLIDITDQNGHHTTYEYDDLGRQTRAIGLSEYGMKEKRLVYDANSNIISQTDGNNYTTYYEYDPLNRLIKITDPLNNFTSYTYDAIGNLKSFTSKKGNITSYDYGPLNRLIKITNPLGDNTSIGYDAVGNIISTTNTRGFTTEIYYDKLNRVIQEKDPMGNSTFYGYDALGNLISVIDPNKNQMNLSYDALNRLETITDALGYKTICGYDNVGNLNSITDENGNTLLFWYDSLNRVIQSGNPIEADYLWFNYDKKGNLLSLKDANQHTMYFTYDDLDRPTSTTTPSGMKESYMYDGNGNIIQRIDASGNITNYTYDPLDRLVKIDYPIGNVTFTFDANDNMLTTSNNGIGLNDTTSMTYDELNRIKTVNIDYGVFDKTIQYTYDEMGNVLTITNPEDGVTSYQYDPLDRLQQVTDPSNDITKFYYDNGSRLQNIIYPNGAYTNYTYDKTDCLLQVAHKKSDHSIISSYDYGYDGVGNRINMTDHLSQLTTYVYDKINRLINVTYHATNTNVQYTYDGIGNRLTKTINYTQITYYNYDGDNKLLSDGTYTYTYDNNGNLISKSDVINITRYLYDYENRLTNIILPNATTINYSYAIFDDRLQKTVGGTSTYFLYDFYDVIAEYDQSGNPTAEYTHGHIRGRDFDEPISIKRNENKGYYHLDGLGSIIALTDQNENIVNTYSYDAFGEIILEYETIKNTHKFTAKEYDKELDLYFYRCRYYNPDIGRFITKDPFGTVDGMNLYVYVNNNPINFVDPCGRKPSGATIGPWHRKWDTDTNYGAECQKALEDLEKELQRIEDRYNSDQRTISGILRQRNDKWWEFIKALFKSIPVANIALKVHIAAGETMKQIPATEPLFTASNFMLFLKELGNQFGVGPDMVKDIIQGEILKALGRVGKVIGKVLGIIDTIEGLASLADKTQDLVDNYTVVSHETENARETRTTNRNDAIRKFKDLVDKLLNTKKVKPTPENADSETVHIDPDGKPDPDSPPGSAGSGTQTPGTQVSGGGHQPGPQSPPSGPKGPNQGGPVVTGPQLLEPESQPTLPVPRTNPPWVNRLPGYDYPPYGNGVGFGAGGGGDLGLPAPDEYCEYRIVYFGSRIVDDLGENRKVLHNAIKWAARHPTTLWNTTVLLMPSWGGYEGWDDYWEDFATEYQDIILLRWSDLQDQRALVTYSELKMINADVLIDSDHYSSTQQGGYYAFNEMAAIQKYLLDEHGYIATYGTVGDNPGQSNQTDRLLSLLGLEKKDGNPHKYTNSEPWTIDQLWHPIFYNISVDNWPNAGDVTGNVDIGVCPLCGEKHLGSKLAHLESSSGNHHSIISAYTLWYAPLSTGGLISQSGGECIVVPQTVYFGNRVVDDIGNNHLALYSAIKWAAEKNIGEETKVLVMPGWGGYDGWSLWQSFANNFPDINLSRWSDSSTSRNPVTTYGLEATEADVLIDSNHSSVTQQGGFYTFGELQAIEWYVKDRGHGYIVTSGSLGNHTQQTNQTEKLMELLGINKTTTIGNYQNDRDWIIDIQNHPIIYLLTTWNPGNVTANIDVEEAEKITHLYSTQGNHHTIISAYEGFGQGTCACECNIPPVANFTWNPLFPTTEDLIQFTDRSEDIDGTIVNWTWDFKDGNISYSQNPTHQYTNDGTYNVILTVKDDSGEPASIGKPIEVTSGGPIVNLDTGEHFSTIQGAIDDSNTLDGHTIYVGNGTYNENIVINKRINLVGEDKEITIIDGNELDDVITITVDNVNITGFTITQGGTHNSISITNTDYITINHTILTHSENGIYLESSNHNTIKNNNASHNNDDGVEIYHNSRYNTIQNNTFIDNGAGVFIYDATNNTIDHNLIRDSTAFGIQLYDAANHNTISNNTILRTTNTTYGDICGDAICLFYYQSTPITNCLIENNDLIDNQRGTTFRQTQYSIIRNNNIKNCSKIGIQLQQSSNNNLFHHNNFLNNTIHANDVNSNTWDDDYPSGGNYWDDYTGVDLYHGPDQDILGSDNIGDTPNDIPGGSNQDSYPLMYPWGAELEGFYLNLADFPMYEAESNPGYNEMCGPACAQMTLNYIWWNSSNHSQPPLLFDNQTWLYDRGRENNTNQSLPYLDTRGLWYIIQYNKPMPYNEFGYNFLKYSNEDLDEMLKRIVLWINYTVGTVGGHKEGHPLHVPSVVPAYGDYTNWMAIRGFHANRTAHPMPDEITVYGFWVNDPLPGGIGENSYKMLASWASDYYQPLETDDIYNGKYVAILEPPEINENAELTIAKPRPRFTSEQQDELKLTQLNKGSEDLIRQSNEWIIQAAIEGVAEELIPYDEDFAAAFAKTIAGTPIFVENTNGNNYYAVPFNALVEKSRSLDLSKKIISKDNTIIVILIDAEDGSFKEASWVKDPVKYLPISEEDAQKIVYETLEEMGYDPGDIESITMELVHRDSTLYYPDWNVTIDELGLEFFIKQDGTIKF